jgi:1-acyl-sn-glycerol-3-phosphate acyltransferase
LRLTSAFLINVPTLRAILITDPLIALATALMGTVSLLVSLFDSTGRAQHSVARGWSRMLLAIGGVKVRVEGLEKIHGLTSCVLVSDHMSLMDTPVVLAFIPLQFRFLAKKGLFKIPFIGYHLHRAGHIPVHRGNARASLKTMAEAAQIVRDREVSVLVFPEGGRSPGPLREFKEGAAYIAIKSGAPAVPVGISGTREVLPMGSVVVRGGEARLRIGDPIPTKGLTLHDRGALTAQLRERVAELMGQPVHSEK